MTASATPSSLPVLGVLPRAARIAVLVILAVDVLAIGLEVAVHPDPTIVFVVAAIGILGLAWILGLATERLGGLAGPQVGAIVNATFGNIAELIIAFFALNAGLVQVVKASLTGSIIGNLLLVLGISVFVGGWRNGTQRFSREIAGSNAALLVLAAIGLLVPAVFAASSGDGATGGSVTEESALIALLLIGGYVASLAYQFTHPTQTLGGHEASGVAAEAGWSGRTAVGVLLAATVLLAILSEILVGSIEPVIDRFGFTPFFVGVVIVPAIGNLAEQLVAVQLAWKDRMEFSMAVCYGSSLQVALFVAPVLVLAGIVLNQPMNLVFEPLEVVAVGAAVGISALIALDGESNWLEGALLAIVYVILAVSFFEFGRPV